jgi:flagellar basal-body rod protein FlgB
VSVPAVGASDPVSSLLVAALDGVALRQRVTADNIANVDTPGFRASSVDFESALRAAISSGEAGSPDFRPGASVTPTDTPVGANGNNVDLRKESLSAMQSQYQYQLLTRAVADRFDLIKFAAGQ